MRFSFGNYENKQCKQCFVEILGWDEETKLDIAIYTLKCGKQNGKRRALFFLDAINKRFLTQMPKYM